MFMPGLLDTFLGQGRTTKEWQTPSSHIHGLLELPFDLDYGGFSETLNLICIVKVD